LLSVACVTPRSSSAAQTAGAAKSAPGKTAAKVARSVGKVKFRPYDVPDPQQGLVVSRLAIPQDWKTTSRVVWNYGDFYMPVHTFARTEAPDGSSWIEFFPAEFFLWLDARYDRAPIGRGGIGGIHHPNITLPQAMVRYVIASNRRNVKNLRLLGFRPVNNLPANFSHVFDSKQPPLQGEGICMRVSYELNGSPMDEEFYGFMTPTETIYAPGPAHIAEYHRRLFLVHSMGAKAGQLETVRPLLGFVATSIEPNKAWQERLGQVVKMQQQYFQQIQAYNKAEVEAAGARSRALTAQSNQFMAQIDAGLAQNRTQSSSSFSGSSDDDFYKSADNFDQYIRGTEHMTDQYGQVSDQPNNYNYHWADGFGNYVHTNDPNLDPNRYMNGNYEQMTPPQ
jgi:hypothetical protein